jgi:hypothetical protein
MSYLLGAFAEHYTLSLAFLLLGAVYGGGAVAALRVRALSSGAENAITPAPG